MLYFFSKIVPVRMKSTFRHRGRKHTATWWQWRDHIWLHNEKRG